MSENKSFNYDSVVKIDVLNLQEAWMNQPGLFMFYSEQSADARAAADKARFEQDRMEAQISADVRKQPAKYSIEKITEASVSNAVLLSEEYKAATMERIEANRQSDVLKGVVTALEHRKKALEDLCFMADKGWNAEPHVYSKRNDEKRSTRPPVKISRKNKD